MNANENTMNAAIKHCFSQWNKYESAAKEILHQGENFRKVSLIQRGERLGRSDREMSRRYWLARSAANWWKDAANGWYTDKCGVPEKMDQYNDRYAGGLVKESDYIKNRPELVRDRPEWAKYLR